MTVGELKEALKNLPSDMELTIENEQELFLEDLHTEDDEFPIDEELFA